MIIVPASIPSNGPPTSNKAHEQQNTGYGRVVLHAMRSGHLDVKAYINDYSVNLLADTSATYVVLTWEDADTLGLTNDLKFIAQIHTPHRQWYFNSGSCHAGFHRNRYYSG